MERLINLRPLRDLVSFVQFKKREKHPCKNVYFNKILYFTKNFTTLLKVTLFCGSFSCFLNCKPAILLKVTLLHVRFSRFLSYTNDTKSRNTPQMQIPYFL